MVAAVFRSQIWVRTALALPSHRKFQAAQSTRKNFCADHNLSADDIVPILADLPENINLVDLDARYGGTNGIGYKALVEEIDARIQSLHRGSLPHK